MTGSLTQVAVAHRDPVKAELAREMRRLYPPDADRPDISLRVLTTGKAELIANVSDALLKNIAQNADHLRMLRELGPKSLIVVPLRVRERALGTILLARTRSGRRSTRTISSWLRILGRRVALAIDNSSLHRSEQEARRRAEQAVSGSAGFRLSPLPFRERVTPSGGCRSASSARELRPLGQAAASFGF